MKILKKIVNSRKYCLLLILIYSQLLPILATLIKLVGVEIYDNTLETIWIWRGIIVIFIIISEIVLIRLERTAEPEKYSIHKKDLKYGEIQAFAIVIMNVSIVALGLFLFGISGQLIDSIFIDIIVNIISIFLINYHFNRIGNNN